MITLKLTPKKKKALLISGGQAAGALVVLLAIFWRPVGSSPIAPPVATAPSSTEQQTIDTSLSLAPTATVTEIASPPAPTPNGCNLSLGFTVTSGDLSSVGNTSYALAAKNIGNTACESASISVYYATNESFVSGSPKATADGYYWNIGALAPGKEYDIALTTNRSAATDGNISTNEACLSASNGADACSNVGTAGSVTAQPSEARGTVSEISLATTYSPAANNEFGAWVWTSASDMSASQMQEVVNEASVNHFNVLYLTVDYYLTLVALPEGTAKTAAIASYEQALTTFLSLAQAKGISVDAEAGWRDWGESGMTQNAPYIMAFVASYNESHTVKFRGVQYDIEPYLLPNYTIDQSGVLTRYVELVAALTTQAKYDDMPLTIVVPHFYDANENWTPEVTVDGVTDYTYHQILALLNTLPNGRIIIMAYRNFATGADSSVALSGDEIQEADATNVKVIVAQETGPVTPSYVTFYGLSRSDLFTQIGVINQSFTNDKSFGGIAVDYLDPFLALP